MGIYIGSIEFDGPYSDRKRILDLPGVYALLHHETKNDEYTLIDVGHSDSLSDWRKSVDIKSIRSEYPEQIAIAVHYLSLPANDRNEIVEEIKKEFELEIVSELAV